MNLRGIILNQTLDAFDQPCPRRRRSGSHRPAGCQRAYAACVPDPDRHATVVAPTKVELRFNEAVIGATARAEIVRRECRVWQTMRRCRSRGSTARPGNDRKSMTLLLRRPLASGTVATRSAAERHTSHGRQLQLHRALKTWTTCLSSPSGSRLYADLMVLAGVTAFTLYALKPEERGTALLPLAKPALILSLLGLLLSGAGMIALVARWGQAFWAADASVIGEIVTQSAIGSAWVVRMVAVAIALVAALSRLAEAHTLQDTGCLLTAVAIATLVWTGHAGATEGWTGTLHRLSDIVHMLAAAVWIGGIAAFAWLLFQPLESNPMRRSG